jgi:glycosyltransferase involved in cell wall biosynthesis
MKIGIDARLIGETGVGRYIQNLLVQLSSVDHENEYVIFLRKREFSQFILPNKRWKKREAEVPWHSIREQIVMPWLFLKERLDLVHVPYFNAAIFYPGRYVLTIHDLTILHVDTGKASTLPYWLYKIRRLGYRIVLWLGIKRASHIVTVSETVKTDIVRHFKESNNRITVTYEGIDPTFLQSKKGQGVTLPVEDAFFLYVGNVYPHKNAEMLVNAYAQYLSDVKSPASLVFVGPSDYFYKKLEQSIHSRGLDNNIIVLHGISDTMLQSLYDHAQALIFPSRMEGFGLPALEALASGCRVICSDIAIFHEILGANAIYVDTTNRDALANAMATTMRKPHDRQMYQKNLQSFLSLYDWKKMAQKTASVYKTYSHSE